MSTPDLLFVYSNAGRHSEFVIGPIIESLRAVHEGVVTTAHINEVELSIDSGIHVRVRGERVHPTRAHVRTFSSPYGLTIADALEANGSIVVNRPAAIRNADSKVATALLLAAAGIPVPEQRLAHHFRGHLAGTDAVSWPRVLKSDQGYGGHAVHLVQSEAEAEAMVRAADGAVVVNQQFITEAAGRDVRVLVAGGRVLAAVERWSGTDDFRANSGRNLAATDLTVEEHQMALHATSVLDLTVAGVDILRTAHGPVVTEVNAAPGLSKVVEIYGPDLYTQVAQALVAAP